MDLGNVVNGTVITIERDETPTIDKEQYTVLTATDNGTAFSFDVTNTLVQGNLNNGDLVNITADIPVSAGTDYVQFTDYWLSNSLPYATVQGIEGYEGTLNDNAYGIRLFVQDISAPKTWDIKAFSEELATVATSN